jgi:WD repeat-containing protein 26
MLPEHRLAVLLEQVKRNQISKCLYHNTATSPSLYQDHSCDRHNFPVNPSYELDKHTGEVWQVKFSNDGTRLATCGGDGTAIIYDVGTWEVLQTLAAHESGVCSLAWSPDDSMIVTCGRDKFATLWNANVRSNFLERSILLTSNRLVPSKRSLCVLESQSAVAYGLQMENRS